MTVEGAIVGSDVAADGAVNIDLEVQAPSWMRVDRVELYENGTLIDEFELDGDDPLRFSTSVEVNPTVDSWYAAIAVGDQDLAPLFTPVEMPVIDLQEVVTESLAGVEAVSAFLSATPPIPRTYPMTPFALTNPVWVDVDGDGAWTAPGRPAWLLPPIEPE
jgi:hypothetical protein